MIEWLTNRWKAGGLKTARIRSEGLDLPDSTVLSVDGAGIVVSRRDKIYAVPWTQVRYVEIQND